MNKQKPAKILLGNDPLAQVDIDFEMLRNHALVSGLPSSGKTNTCFQIFQQLHAAGVPSLIIEPQRTEYRQMFLDTVGTAGGGSIFSLGDESVSPLRFNPLQVLGGSNILSHVESVRSALTTCFELSKQCSQLLEKSLYELYAAHGWNLFRNTNHRVDPDENVDDIPEAQPTLDALRDCLASLELPAHWQGARQELNQTFDSLLSGGKGLMFNSRLSTPAHILYDRPALFELQALGGVKERSFALSMILVQLREYRQIRPIRNQLNHAVIIDDAVYFKNIMGYAKTRIVEVDRSEKQIIFSSLLRELSTVGESVVVSLPLMGNTRPDFLHNFAVKVAHQLSPDFGAEIFREPMSMTDEQYLACSKLHTGSALIGLRDATQPLLVDIPKFVSISTLVPQSLAESNADIAKLAENNCGGDESGFRPCAGCDRWKTGCDPTKYDIAHRISLMQTFEAAYEKYFLSFCIDLQNLVTMRAEIIYAVQSLGGANLKHMNIVELTWCCLCQATERYFDRIGNEHHIKFKLLRSIKDYWIKAFSFAFIKDDTVPHRKLSVNELKLWRDQLKSEQARAQGPYPTCGACTSKCFYRVDIDRILRDRKLHFDFAATINAKNLKEGKRPNLHKTVANFCLLLCERLIDCRNLDVAYCLAVHFLKGLDLSSDAQLVLLMRARDEMESIINGTNLRITGSNERLPDDSQSSDDDTTETDSESSESTEQANPERAVTQLRPEEKPES